MRRSCDVAELTVSVDLELILLYNRILLMQPAGVADPGEGGNPAMAPSAGHGRIGHCQIVS